MTYNTQELDDILEDFYDGDIRQSDMGKAKQSLTSLIKELVAEASNKMSEQEIYAKVAEKAYWFHVVKEYMTHVADWRYLEEAVQGLLDGKHNQEYISDAIKWPVLRWRELNKELADVSAT